jgi:hypothetical protein
LLLREGGRAALNYSDYAAFAVFVKGFTNRDERPFLETVELLKSRERKPPGREEERAEKKSRKGEAGI